MDPSDPTKAKPTDGLRVVDTEEVKEPIALGPAKPRLSAGVTETEEPEP